MASEQRHHYYIKPESRSCAFPDACQDACQDNRSVLKESSDRESAHFEFGVELSSFNFAGRKFEPERRASGQICALPEVQISHSIGARRVVIIDHPSSLQLLAITHLCERPDAVVKQNHRIPEAQKLNPCHPLRLRQTHEQKPMSVPV